MKERPILFSGPMVRAILAGTKTQTRRIAKFPQCVVESSILEKFPNQKGCPHGEVGGRLWVRETWTSGYSRGCWGTIFAADGVFEQGKRQHEKGPHFNAEDRPPITWRPSIFMPRWASRITLEVTDVRVQRLQDISEEDAKAEGVERWVMPGTHRGAPCVNCGKGRHTHVGSTLACRGGTGQGFSHWSYRGGFALIWDSTNAKRGFSWESNPWVWAISFRRVEQARAAA